MISEAHGIPLAVSLTGGNRNDITQLMPLIEAACQQRLAASGHISWSHPGVTRTTSHAN